MALVDSVAEKLLLEKAIIEIVDLTDPGDITVVDAQTKATQLASQKVKYSKLKTEASIKKAKAEAAKKAKQQMQALGNAALAAGDSSANSYYSNLKGGAKGVVRRRFKVQFNPATISINGFGGGFFPKTDFGKSKEGTGKDSEKQVGGITYEAAKTHIEFSVQLVIDESDHLISFPGDFFGMNVSNAIDLGKKFGGDALAKTSVGKKLGMDARESVQDQTEAFLGLLRKKTTRSISFMWGNMVYSGICNGVNAKYTLFNPSGKPVRANINFRMICADESMSEQSMGIWKDYYEEYFGAGKNISYSTYANSWINLKG